MPIIILEGCDAAGKSTLAEELHRITGYEIVKGSSFEIAQKGSTAMFEHMMGLLDRNNIIIDRFYLSNWVYARLFDYPLMSNKQFSELSTKTEKRALTVYVKAHPEIVESRLLIRGDDMIKTESVPAILDAYNEALTDPLTFQALTVHIDTSFYDVKKAASTVYQIADCDERKIYMGGFN